MIWPSAKHCHSQGDTVLVGGPPGEKGNNGELVSERPDGSEVLCFFSPPLIISLLSGFRATGDSKVLKEKRE